MSSTDQLEKWGKANVKHWAGVHASDEIPPGNRLPPIAKMVINYDPSDGVRIHGHTRDGSHWVGLSRHAINGSGSASCQFFDSYANPPDGDMTVLNETKQRFRPWLKRWCPGGFEWNHVRLQAYGADQCGQFSLYFAQNGLPPSQQWRWVSHDLRQNDSRIQSLVKL